MSNVDVVRYGDADLLTAASAARLVTVLSDAQAARGSASVVLTGGGTGIDVLRKLCETPAHRAIDFGRLDVYWGDERFVPAADEERNELQAREALLDHVPIDPERVFPMSASDGDYGDDPAAAAQGYGDLLAQRAGTDGPTPLFDVTLLGLGPEGHTASLFPGTSYAREGQRSVLAVRDCPKPPPTRISLSLPAIQRSTEVWLLAAGESKAEALALAHAGADPADLPVAGARGIDRTLWLLDDDAASRLP